jgi:hypothetical protein
MLRKALLIATAFAMTTRAQIFNSGSTGSDGVLELTTRGTVPVDFRSLISAPHPGNIYHFAAVRIASGMTLKLTSANNGPIFWLSQGPVEIDGTIDLQGEEGQGAPSQPGAGGYPGGAPRKTGYGPSGFRRNAFLIPLVGGNGGDGGDTSGGGGGGGALLIASSTSIIVNGKIIANGGSSLDGMGGAGGAIRLVAPIIEGSGVLSARGGQPGGEDGRVRFECLTNTFAGDMNGTAFAQGKPLGLFLPPDPAPSVRIVSIGGASLTSAEFRVRQSAPMSIVIEATNIPPGTPISLECFSDNGASQTLTTGGLEGTFALSRAVAVTRLPVGRLRCYAKAAWERPAQDRKLP